MDFILNTLRQGPGDGADRLDDNVTQPPAIDAVVGHGLIQQPVAPSTAWLVGVPVVLVLWAILCSSLRFRHEKTMLRRFNYPTRASFAKMTNDDAQQILKYILDYEFPLIYKLSLQFALFKVSNHPVGPLLLLLPRRLITCSDLCLQYHIYPTGTHKVLL